MVQILKCRVCNAEESKLCSGCQRVSYCSEAHQKSDWKKHREECLCFKVVSNEKYGRHLVARRNIEAGTILVNEPPLLTGPKLYTLPICLSCNKRVHGEYFCKSCGYPLCSEECENNAIHKDNECSIFARKYRGPKTINFDKISALYQSILPLRCLILKSKNPKNWDILNEMESHKEERIKESEVWGEYEVNIVKFLKEWIGVEFRVDEIQSCVGFIEVNSFQIRTIKNLEYCGLYKTGALMTHDCTPNTHHAFTESGNIIIRSSVDIKKGEIIKMSYVDQFSPTIERVQLLKQSKYFTCSCQRCLDRTENKSFISALKCSCSSSNYLLPQDPLKMNSIWTCYDGVTGRLGCKNKRDKIEIEAELKRLELILELGKTEENIDNLENLISSTTNKYLHPNHYLLLPLWKQLNGLFSPLAKCKNEELERTHQITQNLLNLYNLLDPGLSRGRGLLLLHLYKIQSEKLKRSLEKSQILENSKVHEDVVNNLNGLKVEIEKLFELDKLIGVKESLI